MIRRFAGRTAFLVALFLVPAGCEPHHSWLRPSDDDDAKAHAVSSSKDKVIGSSADDEDASTFFKDSRRFGGLSREANSIERDLGVSN
jgi:hypothetical protein